MTKNEIINEIKSVVMNNGGEVKGTHSGSLRFFIGENGELFMQYSACCNYHKDVVKNMKYLTKSQLERCLSDIKFYVEKYYNTKAETVETKVENTENTVEVEPKATKKDIIMGLHENDSVECDLETAQSIAQEGFIEIESYEDGLLRGNVCYDKVMNEMFDDYDCVWVGTDNKKCPMSLDDIYTVTKLYDKGYINNLDYDGDDIWHCMVNFTNVLSDFCKRWDSKLSKVA